MPLLLRRLWFGPPAASPSLDPAPDQRSSAPASRRSDKAEDGLAFPAHGLPLAAYRPLRLPASDVLARRHEIAPYCIPHPGEKYQRAALHKKGVWNLGLRALHVFLHKM